MFSVLHGWEWAVAQQNKEHIGLYFCERNLGQKSWFCWLWTQEHCWHSTVQAGAKWILYIVSRREYMISRWSWDQQKMTSAPSLEAADSFLMGRAGSPVGFASEKTVFVAQHKYTALQICFQCIMFQVTQILKFLLPHLAVRWLLRNSNL